MQAQGRRAFEILQAWFLLPDDWLGLAWEQLGAENQRMFTDLVNMAEDAFWQAWDEDDDGSGDLSLPQ